MEIRARTGNMSPLPRKNWLDALRFSIEPRSDLDHRQDCGLRGPIYGMLRKDGWSIEQCSAALRISVAELRRALAAEGTSFRQVRRDAIIDEAKTYLMRGVATEDVAALLGYSDGRSFRRAVKLAGGGSIGQLRKGFDIPLRRRASRAEHAAS